VPLPTFNIQLTFNAPVTSRVLAPGRSEALLLINEPSPSQQRACGTPGDTVDAFGNCTIIGTGNADTEYDGSPGHPNVFQGMVAGPNSVVWLNVPVDLGGSATFSGEAALRFTNLRVDAAAIAAASFGPVLATLTTTGINSLPVLDNPQQTISQVQTGFVSSAETPTQCAPEATTLSGILGKKVSQVDLLASKGFPASFKPRTAAPFVDDNTSPPPVNQDVLGAVFTSETDFFNSSFPTMPGHGNLGLAGLADQGTRIAVRIANAPPGVTLYSPVVFAAPGACFGPGPVARRILTNANGSSPFTPVPGDAAGVAPLVEQGGVLTAVYEVLSACPQSLTVGNLDIPIFADAPSLGDATAIVGLAPFGVEPKTTALGPPPPPGNPPIPRFVLPTGPGLALTPLVCAP